MGRLDVVPCITFLLAGCLLNDGVRFTLIEAGDNTCQVQ